MAFWIDWCRDSGLNGVGTQQRSPASPFDKHNLASRVIRRAQCRRWCACCAPRGESRGKFDGGCLRHPGNP